MPLSIPDPATINAQSIAKAIEVANEFRAYFGLEELEDLPAAVPKNPRQCILQKAFNFECKVYIEKKLDGNASAVLEFDAAHLEHAKKLAKLSGGILKRESFLGATVRLPLEIGRLARQFDLGLLPEKYYEDPV